MPRRQLPVDSSWRMVEGDNDSFDTTVVNSLDDDGDSGNLPYTSSPYAYSQVPTQPASQLSQVASSQGSIGDFVARADEERVLMRTPFRPSVPPGGSTSASASTRRASDSAAAAHKMPEPEFHMPRVPVAPSPRMRRRQAADRGPGVSTENRPRGSGFREPRTQQTQQIRQTQQKQHTREEARSLVASGSAVAAGVLGETAWWALEVVGMALRWTQKPLSILLAVYMLLGLWTVVSNMVTRSVMVSLQPICRLPGATYLDLPFCGRWPDPPPLKDSPPLPDGAGTHVEFDELMSVQSQFEQVLERSAEGVGLPLEMRRSETSIRDLRTLVRHSELPHKEELLQELDGFVGVAGRAARDLQFFNTHVGSAVDAVISINRWTVRYIDEMAEAQRELGGGGGGGGGLLSSGTALSMLLPAPLDAWTEWVLSPFQPALVFDERLLLGRYVENTAMVSERIAALIVEAQALLLVLTRADQHLDGMHDVVTRQNARVQREQRDVLANIWTLFGANRRELDSVRSQLALLAQVGRHRRSAIEHVSDVMHDLEKMQAELMDLRERVAAPAVVAGVEEGGVVRGVPLSVHVETINSGVERLDAARRRMRGQEDERVREVLAQARGEAAPREIEGK